MVWWGGRVCQVTSGGSARLQGEVISVRLQSGVAGQCGRSDGDGEQSRCECAMLQGESESKDSVAPRSIWRSCARLRNAGEVTWSTRVTLPGLKVVSAWYSMCFESKCNAVDTFQDYTTSSTSTTIQPTSPTSPTNHMIDGILALGRGCLQWYLQL
jgi:hypothetical protein